MVLDNTRTLLLDNGYQPLSVVGWQRALLLAITDRVDVVEYYDGLEVRSPSRSFTLPAVIRLRQYLRQVRRAVPYSRRNVLIRDALTCQYCGSQPPRGKLTIDHVLPRSRGGDTSWDNIVTACAPCNSRKGSRTPAEARMPLRRRPMQPRLLREHRVALRVPDVPEQWALYLAG
ncbi:MAG: HNH endonuclease [Proteobacteria bacterium]|nr:HNH endonuclease [Pseudomonadota bacterium]